MKEILRVPIDSGIVIKNVTPNSTADNSGLMSYDVIFSINGNQVLTVTDFLSIMSQINPGNIATIIYFRGPERNSVALRLENYQNALTQNGENILSDLDVLSNQELKIGFRLADLDVERKRVVGLDPYQKGVLLIDIEPYSLAEQLGFSLGDIIIEVDKIPVSQKQYIIEAIKDAQVSNTKLLFRVKNKDDDYKLIVLNGSVLTE
ncbi:MAG: PDZ domain-containing protein [Bdellovibrionales bacterium]|nr:PDZ domain-containing protein [Bdellovibrionales bacterium]